MHRINSIALITAAAVLTMFSAGPASADSKNFLAAIDAAGSNCGARS